MAYSTTPPAISKPWAIPYKSDFVSLDLKQYKHPLKGIAQGLEIAGEGVVEYAIVDEEGNSTTLRMKGLYKDI